jgi:hypothetical protein
MLLNLVKDVCRALRLLLPGTWGCTIKTMLLSSNWDRGTVLNGYRLVKIHNVGT